MAPLTFADAHNMVAFLSKSDAKAIIRRDLQLDDADGVECLPNDEIFEELARIGYEKPPPKLTFYKAFFSTAKRTTWNEFSCFMAYAVICLATVDDITTYNTRYTSSALTQKVFANMMRVGKGFLGVETHLFDYMLVQPQPQAEEGVAELEKDKNSQALEILKLKKRVNKIERKKKSKPLGLKRQRRVGTTQRVESSTDTVLIAQKDAPNKGKIAAIYADKGITLVDVETDEEVVAMDAESQGRLNQEDANAASKGVSVVSAPELVSAAEPRIFDDEDVTMTMAQTLIKLKVEKAKLLDEQIAQKLSAVPSEDREKALWVELKRLFEPDADDVKENSKKVKIESKPDKHKKRGEAEKSQKQLQWIEEEKLNKMQKEGPKMQTHAKSSQVLKKERKENG
nr:hypothetical protein [Tanacetum cinerariifolium]